MLVRRPLAGTNGSRGIARAVARSAAGGAALLALTLGVAGSAFAQSVPQVPAVSLPAVPAQPGMLFAPADVPSLQARRTIREYAQFYNPVKSLVDSNIGRVSAGLGDDLLGRFAKGAAGLHALGELPASGPYRSYRDAAVAAVRAIATRTPNFFPGSGSLQAQYDSSTLQCMAEAFDLLRGSGLSAQQELDMRQKIFNWAGAITGDVPLGLNASNIMCKSGAALVSAALALPDEAAAASWLSTGTDYVNRVLADKLSPEGWWREGPHYTNYTLNNLVSAAWHVRNRTGVDWFATLRPLVNYALDARLPSGLMSPYEEGVSVSFPFHTMLAAYGGDPIAAEMQWAWRSGGRQLGSYQNQQLHDLTAFVVYEFGGSAVPVASPTRFRAGDENLVVVRSGYDPDAIHASLLTAVDYSLLELISSRHNLRNPLDLVLHSHGTTLLPTSGGGPLITRSPNRAHYLSPTSNNTILVRREAPFIANAGQVALTDLLDTESDANTPHQLLDVATTTVSGAYMGANAVRRTLGMVGGNYVIVCDEVESSGATDVAVPWRGRGTRELRAATPSMIETRWSFQGVTLEHAAASGTSALTRTSTSGFYADSWNHEEAIQGIEVRTSGATSRILNVLDAHASSTAAPRSVTDHSASGVAVVQISGGVGVDWIGLSAPGAAYTLGQLSANARLALVRTEAGLVRGAALVRGTEVGHAGRVIVRSSAPVTVAVTSSTDRIRATLAQDTPFQQFTLRFDGFADVDPAKTYGATHNGAALASNQIRREGDSIVVDGVVGTGVLIVEPAAPGGGGSPGGGSTGGGSSSSGGGSSSSGCSYSPGNAAAHPAPIILVLLALAFLLLLARGVQTSRSKP